MLIIAHEMASLPFQHAAGIITALDILKNYQNETIQCEPYVHLSQIRLILFVVN